MKRSNTWLMVLATLLVVVPLALTATAQAPQVERSAGPNPGVPAVPALRVDGGGQKVGPIGTAMFDNDTPFSRFGTNGGTVGNRFALGPAADPHSIATVSFALGGNFGASVVMTVWDVNAASAVVLARQLVGTVTPIGSNPATTARFVAPVATAIPTHSGSFIAGIRNTSYGPCSGNTGLATTCDGVALTAGNGSPHAARVVFTSGAFVPLITMVGTTGADIANVNAIFRATGKNLPVELMQFGVE